MPVWIVLLEHFAVANDTFTEDDALTSSKRQMTVGRLYESWKKARTAMDPGFDSRLWREQQRQARVEEDA